MSEDFEKKCQQYLIKHPDFRLEPDPIGLVYIKLMYLDYLFNPNCKIKKYFKYFLFFFIVLLNFELFYPLYSL